VFIAFMVVADARSIHSLDEHVSDYDEYRNVLEVNVSTVGIDLTTHVKRTVKNDVGRWILGQPQWQEECSSGSGKTLCRTIVRTTNTFGEVETETTASGRMSAKRDMQPCHIARRS